MSPDSRVIRPTPFVILQLLVYCASLSSQTHDLADSEMLNPGGQVGLMTIEIVSSSSIYFEHGLPSGCNSIVALRQCKHSIVDFGARVVCLLEVLII